MFSSYKKVLIAANLLFLGDGFANDSVISKSLAEYRLAIDDLDFFYDQGLISVCSDNSLTPVDCENNYAFQSLKNYYQKSFKLFGDVLLNLRGNNLLLGAGLACLSRLTGGSRKKMALGILPGVAGLLILQKQQIGVLPYYNLYSYQRKSDLLQSNKVVFTSAAVGIITAAIGYIGVNYIFDRWDGFKKTKEDNEQSKLEDIE